jgi:hypothetical protein
MISFDWAINKFKLEQAQNALKAQGVELTEANIKARYILQGGAVQEKLPIFEDGEEEAKEKPAKAVKATKATKEKPAKEKDVEVIEE